jgi:hypothetical protein
MSDTRRRLLKMGAEQGGRRLFIRPTEPGKVKQRPEVCANYSAEKKDWLPTAKYAKILGQKTPEERKDDAKATTAEKVAAAATGTGIPVEEETPAKAPAKKAPAKKRKPAVKKKAAVKKT